MNVKINKQLYLLATIGLFIISCNTSKIPLTFVLLSENINNIPEVDSNFKAVSRNYIIYNYKNNDYCEKQIDSFAHRLGNENKDKYSTFALSFYKASSETNMENLRKNPRQLDRYSNQQDLIRNYYWSSKTFIGKYKYKNGKLMDTDEIGVIEAPPLKKQ